jgi:hypothetical protein
MTFEEFIQQFDFEGSVILLIGKRKVFEDDVPLLINLGRKLALNTKYAKFRSGNAAGADELFIKGVEEVSPERIELVVPYKNHRKKNNTYGYVQSVEDELLSEPSPLLNYTRENWDHRLVDRYKQGKRDRSTIQVSYFLRNTLMVIGSDRLHNASCCLYYDDLNFPFKGGTGYTLSICKKNNRWVANQSIWKKWL